VFLMRLELVSKNLYKALATISKDTCFPMVYGTIGEDHPRVKFDETALECSNEK
jgi:hypothetical protein